MERDWIFRRLKEITFEEPDMDTFLGLPMAFRRPPKLVATCRTVFNAANELAVKMFLQEKFFLDIYEIISGQWKDINVTQGIGSSIEMLEVEQTGNYTNELKAGGRLSIILAIFIFQPDQLFFS